MKTLKELWNKVKEKLKNVGVEISDEYHPDVIFLETLAHRVHMIEVGLGIVPADSDDAALIAQDHAAAPGHAEIANAATSTVDPIIVKDPGQTADHVATAIKSDFDKKNELQTGNTVWDGHRHVLKTPDQAE